MPLSTVVSNNPDVGISLHAVDQLLIGQLQKQSSIKLNFSSENPTAMRPVVRIP